jgi:hypothetical protein
MTAPYSFQPLPVPGVQPGPFQPAPTGGDQLQSGIAGLIKAMAQHKELQMQQQQLDQQQQEYASVQKERGVRTEGLQQELQSRQQALQAAQKGLNAYQQWVGSGADFSQFGPIVAKISDPLVAQDFANRVKDHLSTVNTAAEAKSNTANAEVNTATVAPRIQTAQMQPQVTQGQIAQTTAQTQLTGLQVREAADKVAAQQRIDKTISTLAPELQGPTRSLMDFARAGVALPKEVLPLIYPALAALKDVSPEKVNAFKGLVTTGQFTMGQAADFLKIPLPAGVDATAKMPKPGSTDAMMQRNQALLPSIVANDQIINDLVKKGTRLSSTAATLRKWLPGSGGNLFTPSDQQQMVAAGRVLAQSWQMAFSARGGGTSQVDDVEKTLLPQPHDNDATLAQKAVQRQIGITALQAQQNTDLGGVAVIDQAIAAAKAAGIKSDGLQFWMRQRAAAKAAETGPQTYLAPMDSRPDSLQHVLNRAWPQ